MKRMARLRSDYSPNTVLSIVRSDDGDICLRVFGDGEMRIATSGSRLHGDDLIRVIDAFQKLIDAIPTEEGRT